LPYVFLNPDGTEALGLMVIVEAPTGVTYAHQCAGLACDVRSVEGFLIPVGGPDASREIHDWFWRVFRGACYNPKDDWSVARIAELRDLVARVPCWRTVPDSDAEGDQRLSLMLDESRIGECVEAWIPVITPYGSGILVLENSD
jgi:hypothetical protein